MPVVMSWKMCCKKEKCIPRLLVAIVVLLILNLGLGLVLGFYSIENKYSNDRQLYILNEGYHQVEEAKVAKIVKSTNNKENLAIFGKWKGYKSENFQKFLKRLGAPWIVQKMAANSNPTMTIRRESATKINVETEYAVGSTKQSFVIGELSQFKPLIGPTMDTVVTWSDNKMVSYFVEAGKGDPLKSGNTNVREILENGDMLLTIIWGKDVSKRWFKRVGPAPTIMPIKVVTGAVGNVHTTRRIPLPTTTEEPWRKRR